VTEILRSENDQWLLNDKLAKVEAKAPYTVPYVYNLKPSVPAPTTEINSFINHYSDKKSCWYPTANNINNTTLKQSEENEKWLIKKPKQNDRPMNEMAQDIATWESILGWQNVLEKIHASGDDKWLLPASRST